MPTPLQIADLDRAADAFLETNGRPEGPWQEFQGRILALSPWFDLGLEPHSTAYRKQQLRLWQEIAGIAGEYRPAEHERTGGLNGPDRILSEDGRIILSGEPIVPADSRPVPYPWGIRLEASDVAVVRSRKWFELGFQEGFLVSEFIRNGFVWQSHPCVIAPRASLHVFQRRPNIVALENYQIPEPDCSGWHGPQKGGRFTRELAHLPLILQAATGEYC